MAIPLQNVFVTVQRFQVIWMFPFQRIFRFGEVRSADEKHFSTDTTVIGVAEYSITIFLQNYKLCRFVRVIANLQLRRSCAQGVYFHFVSVNA